MWRKKKKMRRRKKHHPREVGEEEEHLLLRGFDKDQLAASEYEYEYDDDEEEEDSSFAATTFHPNSVLPLLPSREEEERKERKKAEEQFSSKSKRKDIFHNFGSGSFGSSSSFSDEMPVFLEEPVDSYIIKEKPTVLHCKVIKANKAYFTCDGEARAESHLHREKDYVDEDGQVVKDLSLEVRQEEVDEIFGTFWCQCDAWSSKGKVSSRNVTVETARKNSL